MTRLLRHGRLQRRRRSLSAALWAGTATISVVAVITVALGDRGRERLALLFDRPAETAVATAPQDDTAQLYAELSRVRSETRMLALEKDAIATKLAEVESQLTSYTGSIPPADAADEDVKTRGPREAYPPMPRPTASDDAVDIRFTKLPADAEPPTTEETAAAPDEIAKRLAQLASPEARNSDLVVAATRFAVELAEAASLQEIRAEWLRLQRSAPGPLGGLKPSIVMDDRADGSFRLRLLAGDFANAAEATSICNSLKTHDIACEPVSEQGIRLVMQ